MNRDEFKWKVRNVIYETIKKYVIEDIFNLHEDSYVNREDYFAEVNEQFKCKKVDIKWNDMPTIKDVVYYYGVFSVLFSGKSAPMYFVIKCTIEPSNTTDIFNYLGVALQDGERQNVREYRCQRLEKEIRKAVEVAVPHTYIEPKTAWPTVNPNITQLSTYYLAYGVATAQHNKFEIKEIIINEPAMIVFWKDGTKTVVKAQDGETFDEEKGLAMAYAKKALGNNYAAYGRFKQRLKHAKKVTKSSKPTKTKEDIIKLDDLIPGKLPDIFEDKS